MCHTRRNCVCTLCEGLLPVAACPFFLLLSLHLFFNCLHAQSANLLLQDVPSRVMVTVLRGLQKDTVNMLLRGMTGEQRGLIGQALKDDAEGLNLDSSLAFLLLCVLYENMPI